MKSNITEINNHPFKNSPIALTIEAEIKRVAESRDESINETISRLAKFTNLSIRQIYNYRMGKTQVPENLILIFTKQFASTALVSAWLAENEVTEVPDNFDLVRLANKSARQILQTHDSFLEAFEDGHIDGFEITELKKSAAKSVANIKELEHIAELNHQQRRVA